MYTKKNPTDGQLLNVNVNKTIAKSNFNPQRLTKMIIHGFIDTPLSNWVNNLLLPKTQEVGYTNKEDSRKYRQMIRYYN